MNQKSRRGCTEPEKQEALRPDRGRAAGGLHWPLDRGLRFSAWREWAEDGTGSLVTVRIVTQGRGEG